MKSLESLLAPLNDRLSAIPGRAARPAGVAWNSVKTLVQIIVMWSIFYFLLPGLIFRFEEKTGLRRFRFASPAWRLAGLVVFACGGTLGLVSAAYMVANGEGTPLPADSTRKLVIAGPYRYVRNPMAMGSLAQGFAAGLYMGSPLIILYTLAGTIGWNYLVRPWEELDMEKRFGEAFREYRAAVRCWVPTLSPYSPEQSERKKE